MVIVPKDKPYIENLTMTPERLRAAVEADIEMYLHVELRTAVLGKALCKAASDAQAKRGLIVDLLAEALDVVLL